MKQLHQIFSRFQKKQDGALAIEAAIALPVFLSFVLGAILLGHAMMIRHSMYYGLDTAGRQAMIAPSTSNTALRALALARMTGMDTALVTATVTDSTMSGLASKQLTASYTYTFPQLIGLSSLTMTTTVNVPVE